MAAKDYISEVIREKLKEVSLEENDLLVKCDNRTFAYLSKKISFDFGLAISLGLTESDIQEIQGNSQLTEGNKVIKMFWKWKEIKKTRANYRTLIEALIEDENIHLVEQTLDYLKKERPQANLIPSILGISLEERDDDTKGQSPNTIPFQTQRSLPSSLSKPQTVPPFSRSQSHTPMNKMSQKDTSVCAKNPDNHGWMLIEKYYDKIVHILCHNEDLCLRVLELSYRYLLLDVGEKRIIEQLPCVEIKSKAVVGYVLTRVSGARNYISIFAKFASVLQSFPVEFKEIYDHLEIEATSYRITLQSTGPRRKAISQIEKSSDDPIMILSKYDDDLETPAIKKYSRQLRGLYRKLKPDPKWSPSSSRCKKMIYVDLAVIESDNDFCNDPFVKATIRGTTEDITSFKKPLSFDDLCQIEYGSVVLIEGAPGIGKSMLAYEMCSQWMNETNLLNYTLLLLLRLRDEEVHYLRSVQELLGHFLNESSWKEKAIRDIIDNSGEGVIIILEGFDELPLNVARPQSIFIKLPEVLPLATVVYTSRPSARHLLMSGKLDFSKHVEVIGFMDKSIKEYIANYFDNDQDRVDLFERRLKESPKVASCLYIPINLAIVCHIFANDNNVPIVGNVTSTKLYEALVKMLLYRHMKEKDSTKLIYIDNLHNLPDPETQDIFIQLCQLAYDGLFNKEKTTKLTFTIVPEETLGLMQKEVKVIAGSGDVIVYSFLHLTIQEFLAAFYITAKLPHRIQFYFDRYINVKNFFTVLHFLAGLTKLESCSLKIKDDYFHNLNIFQFLSEAGNDNLAKQLFNKPCHRYKVSRILPKATPHDMFVLGKCIALSSCHWELSFTLRGMTSEHIENFKEGLSVTSLTLQQEIQEISFSLNQIGNEGLEHILQFPDHILNHLLSLRLVSTDLGDDCVKLFEKHVHKLIRLKKLLFNNNLFQEGQQLPLLIQLSSLPALEYVSFSKLDPSECSILLNKFRSLARLDLYQLSSVSIEAILKQLPNSTSLQELHIHQSQCTHKVFTSSNLSQKIQACPQLKIIEFINCAVTTESLSIIIEAILRAPQLEKLSLDNNYINDQGVSLICDMIQQLFSSSLSTSSFIELDLRHNPFTERSVRSLIRVLTSGLVKSNFILYISLRWEEFARKDPSFLIAEKHLKFKKIEE